MCGTPSTWPCGHWNARSSPVNQKRAYKAPGEQPEFVYEITVNGRRLSKGMHASLERGIGHPAGRYEFRYAEPGKSNGEPLLFFYGPVRRSRQKYRQVVAAAVKTVHSKTKERNEENI